ncbi:hypothetical protein [Pseudoduganella chitinolytica]|uniref:Uncharacterized protein n=1 Tax=Pseudoduganella chitinolytica TaxID=34070 RepID=A0ABY8B6X5_9BURK|nr:hypothetical protein [Pseudoduganella chitinolytica]WEF30756.1 hypothetical protein PX653_14855 [Pseudoduganella chitinolytica]
MLARHYRCEHAKRVLAYSSNHSAEFPVNQQCCPMLARDCAITVRGRAGKDVLTQQYRDMLNADRAGLQQDSDNKMTHQNGAEGLQRPAQRARQNVTTMSLRVILATDATQMK